MGQLVFGFLCVVALLWTVDALTRLRREFGRREPDELARHQRRTEALSRAVHPTNRRTPR